MRLVITWFYRCAFIYFNLQTQVGRLQAALAKTEEGEEQLKVKVQGLSKNVSTKEVMTQDLQVILF